MQNSMYTVKVTANTTNAVTELRENRCSGGLEVGSSSSPISSENSKGHGNTMNMMCRVIVIGLKSLKTFSTSY
jgi:hypothetical protein